MADFSPEFGDGHGPIAGPIINDRRNGLRRAPNDRHDPPESEYLLRKARQIVAERTSRADWFAECYVGDAAWNMLLALYIAHDADRAETVTSVCAAARAPSTTALRWIHALRQAGFVDFSSIDADKRCILVRLTPRCLTAMQGHLRAISAEELD